MTWSIDGYEWKRDREGKWKNVAEQPTPQEPARDIITVFQQLGIDVDAQFVETTSNDIQLRTLADTIKKAKLHIKKGQTDSGANACATKFLECYFS